MTHMEFLGHFRSEEEEEEEVVRRCGDVVMRRIPEEPSPQ